MLRQQSGLARFGRLIEGQAQSSPVPAVVLPGIANMKASGYEGYAIVVSNAHLQVYPQENNRYETRDALACVAARLLVLCAYDLFDHSGWKKMLGGLGAGGGE